MVNEIITVAMLLVGTALVSYIAFLGRLTSRTVLLLMPAATMSVCSIMIMMIIGHPWLIPIAALLALWSIFMMGVGTFLLVYESRHRKSSQDKPTQGNASYEAPSNL